jgi:protein associated with RNAse G/E
VEFYVNIASPYLIEEDTLKYIDFDLDFKIIGKDLISIKRLDEHEFKENMVKYNYNSKLIEKINTAENKILEMYRNKSLMKLIKANLLHIKE